MTYDSSSFQPNDLDREPITLPQLGAHFKFIRQVGPDLSINYAGEPALRLLNAKYTDASVRESADIIDQLAMAVGREAVIEHKEGGLLGFGQQNYIYVLGKDALEKLAAIGVNFPQSANFRGASVSR